MEKLLVDTSVLIEHLRLRRKKTLYEKLLVSQKVPVVSFVTPAELWAGRSVWENRTKAKLLEDVLSGIEIVFPSLSTLKLSGKLRAKHKISLLDAFVSACAIERKLPLATLNIKDFQKIKEIRIFELSK